MPSYTTAQIRNVLIAGHGGSVTLPEAEMRRRLRALVGRMEAD